MCDSDSLGKGGDGIIEDKIFSEENVAGNCLSNSVYLCQQQLRKQQKETKQIRQELAKLTKQQTELQEEYTAIAEKLASYQQECRELAAVETEVQQQLHTLDEQQAVLKEEYAQKLNNQLDDSMQMPLQRKELDRLLVTKCETKAVVTQNLTKKEEVTAQLASLSERGVLTQQNKRIQEEIIDLETQLHQLDIEKKKLAKCLSLLGEQKPEAYILLSGSRNEQITAVAQYNQYLMEFVSVAQKIQCQQQVPPAAFLDQDITLLIGKLNILKQRQVDLASPETDTINHVRELLQVLNDTAQDYGWRTSLLRANPQGVVVNNQSISQLRQEANDLLIVAPPGLLARMGLCAQWKKELFDLIVKAKSMKELSASPTAVRRSVLAEIESILLQCRHLTRRIYETCYRHLLACGHSLDQAYNKIQNEIAELTKQLLHSSKQAQQLIMKMSSPTVTDEFNLRQRLDKIEDTLQDAQNMLLQQESGIQEIQQLLQENGVESMPNPDQVQADLKNFSQQLDAIEQQRQPAISRLEQSRRQLAALENNIVLAKSKLEELVCNKEAVSPNIEIVTKQLEDRVSPDNEIKITLVTEWISRIREFRPESQVLVNDRIPAASPVQQIVANKTAAVESIAHSLVAKQPGLVLVETREWLLPVAVLSAEYALEGYRSYNPIEEFSLKCIASGLGELSSLEGIAALLRLDVDIVISSCCSLLERGVLRETQTGDAKIFALTGLGQEVCQTGLVPATLCSGALDLAVNAQYELLDVCQHDADTTNCHNSNLPVFRHCNKQEEQDLRSLFPIGNQEVSYIIKEKSKEWYTVQSQNYVANVSKTLYKQDSELRFAEIWLYDVVQNQLFCRVWNFAQQAFCSKLEFALYSLEGQQRLEQVKAACTNNKQWTALLTKLCHQDNLPKSPVIQESLYGLARRNAFLQAIGDMQEVLLLMVPDITEIATDSEVVRLLRNAVNRGGIIFIGWGTAQNIDAEQQLPAAELMERLQSILDGDGLPGVFLFYVGNIDSRAVLVDHQYHLLSWLQYLSYCGEQLTCNQSAVRVVDKSLITEYSVNLQALFLKQLEGQLLTGWLADEGTCITWFYALLRLSEHNYICEVLAEEALDKVIANHSDNTLFNLLAVYVKVDKYEFGFGRLWKRLAEKEDSHTKLIHWLDNLQKRNPKAYSKITLISQAILKGK